MPSLISGYEYDIFISYRHKDNKYDGWVTAFVSNLRKELEATFKEDVSIYFDENPHDGLLETHHVDKSLESKLRCLILIPIISRTYCDTKSFAWQNEFCVFNRLSKEDQFGRDIKVGYGNVASRILPIKIHDLDEEDKLLLEVELGGALRPIEFIYKSPGVNRPLTPNDNPDKNFNKSLYRDQINKVANAIKEIISALKSPSKTSVPLKEIYSKPTVKQESKISPRAVFLGLFILLGLAYLIYYFTSQGYSEQKIKSIAVLPLDDLSGDPEQVYLTAGLHDALIGELGKLSGLRVISKTSTLRYPGKKMLIQEIAKELGVDAIVEGSVVGSGDQVRIQLQLIEAFPHERHLWAQEYTQDLRNILLLQNDVVRKIAREINLKLSPKEEILLTHASPVNPDAYKAYLKGMFHYDKLTERDFNIALEQFELARSLEPDLALAYAGIAMVWVGRVQQGLAPYFEGGVKVKQAAHTAIELDSTLSDIYATLGIINCWMDWNYKEAEKFFNKAISINANNSRARAYLSHVLNILNQPDRALEQIEVAIALDPFNSLLQGLYGMDLNFARQYDKAIDVLNQSLKNYPDDPLALATLRTSYHMKARHNEALDIWKKSYVASKDLKAVEAIARGEQNGGYEGALENLANYLIARSDSVFVTPWRLGTIYVRAGMEKEAIDWLEKAYYAHDSNMPYIGVDPIFEPLLDNPRFIDLLKRMNLLDAAQK
jgi:TolB-like protein/tetratricopeptide (TPR) repeat protein